MTSIDCNTSPIPTDGPWGRSAREHSPKFPRRKISFNGDKNDNSNNSDYDSIPGIEESSSSDDHYLLGFEQQGHDTTSAMPVVLRKAERRASTGRRPIVRPQMESERAFFGYTEKKSRRISIGGPRPCMEATFGSMQANMDGPIQQRRRVSLGGTTARPERANSWLGDEAAFDEPILRPYRQLSSENLCDDMCIGEETDEDLSIRTLRTADNNNSFSNRSFLPNFSNRSNRSSFVPSATVDFSNGSNRSCLPDFTNRGNRSFIRTIATATADLTGSNNRSRTTLPVSDVFAEQKSSPVLEEDEANTNTMQTNDILVMSLQQNPATTTPQKNDKPKRPSISKSNTWPTNLRILLSIRRLTQRNLMTTDITTTTTTTDRKLKAPQRRRNKLLQTLRRASEVLEEEEPSSM